jgi:hypothetical protein
LPTEVDELLLLLPFVVFLPTEVEEEFPPLVLVVVLVVFLLVLLLVVVVVPKRISQDGKTIITEKINKSPKIKCFLFIYK